MKTTIRILSFDPLRIELPDSETIPAGELCIGLPPLTVTIARGWSLLPDATITSETDGFGYTITTPEPTPVAQWVELIQKTAGDFKQLHSELQATLKDRPLMSFGEAMHNGIGAVALTRYLEGPGLRV